MWIFLVTEVMFFGGLLMAYLLYRVWYPVAWSEGSLELDIVLGGFNTVVLIGSSLTMALAVRAAQTGAQKATVRWLLLTMALGLTFLVIKVFEYQHKWELNHIPGPNFQFEGPHAAQVQIFLSLYFGLTGLHALHMLIGFVLLSVIAWMAHKAPVHAGVVHAGGVVGSVLALRRYRLDLPVSAPVPGGQGASGGLAHVWPHFAEDDVLHDFRGAHGADRHHGDRSRSSTWAR